MGKRINPNRKEARSVGSEIVEALQNAVAYAKDGHSKGRAHRVMVAPQIDVRRVRRKLGLSQNDFAEKLGINAATLT